MHTFVLLNCSLKVSNEPKSLLIAFNKAPVGSPPLRELAKGKKRVAIAIEDASRPVPNSLLIDALLGELQSAGVAAEQVTVVVATGLHRPMTNDEMAGALGVNIALLFTLVFGLGTLLAGIFVSAGLGGAGFAEGMNMGSQLGVQLIGIISTMLWTAPLPLTRSGSMIHISMPGVWMFTLPSLESS